MAPRIVLGGVFHETNTFLKSPTSLHQFDSFRGEEILQLRGNRSTTAGFLESAETYGWEVHPTVFFRGRPSGMVSDDVYDRLCEEFIERCPGDADALFLILHGAMASPSHLDFEGDFLAFIRSQWKACPPIFGVLDLHVNFSSAMARHANALLAYRKNPHTDAFETTQRCADMLKVGLESGRFPETCWRHSRHLLPPTLTGTDDDPMKSLEIHARQAEESHPGIEAVNIFAGFAHADVPDAGLAYSIISHEPDTDWSAVFDSLDSIVRDTRPDGMPEEDLETVLDECDQQGKFPAILAEPADNIGGGTPGDNTRVLEAMTHRPHRSGGVILWDPESVTLFQDAQPGDVRTVSLGGKSGELGAEPLSLEVEFISRSDGKFQLEDPHSHLASSVGLHIDMGPTVQVRHQRITILLTSVPTPPFDLAQWRSQGVQPEDLDWINVKSAVAFRQAYEKIAGQVRYVQTVGPCSSDLFSLPYQNLKRPVWPLD